MTRVFLDANVYFAASASSTGASALILEFASKGLIHVTASRLVLREAERNLRGKRPAKDLQAFHRLLKLVKLRIIPTPSEDACAKYEGIIHPKDVPVLAAAVSAKVDYLITLDRRHFLTQTVTTQVKGLAILTPGDFLQEIVQRGSVAGSG